MKGQWRLAARLLGLGAGLVLGAGLALAAPPEWSTIPPLRAELPGRTAASDAVAPLTSIIPPRHRAAQTTPVPDAMQGTDASAYAPMTSTAPPLRPASLATARPEEMSPAPAPSEATPPAPDTENATALCGDPALSGRAVAPILSRTKGCGLDDGVEITGIAGLGLSQPATLDCPTARALSGWVQNALLPAANNSGLRVSGLEIADSYACRPRNNVAGNKISEHGLGHAIDIAGITLKDGDQVSVLTDWGRGGKGRFLATIRRAACGMFTTVLGPGSDRFHRTHLHFDTARGRRPYCP